MFFAPLPSTNGATTSQRDIPASSGSGSSLHPHPELRSLYALHFMFWQLQPCSLLHIGPSTQNAPPHSLTPILKTQLRYYLFWEASIPSTEIPPLCSYNIQEISLLLPLCQCMIIIHLQISLSPNGS